VRLDEPGAEGLDIDNRDEGSLVHAVLERFVRERVARGAWPPGGSEADLAEARTAAQEVFLEFEREGRTGDPSVWVARREAVLSRLDRVVRAEARDHGGLAPALLEHAFGGRSGRPPLALAHGDETVRLRGRIDRVDVGPDRLLVLDYKNAKAGRSGHAELLDPESFGRTSFQIPTYLLAAARDLPGRRRLLATYALLRSAERLPPVEVEAVAAGIGAPAPVTEPPGPFRDGAEQRGAGHPREGEAPPGSAPAAPGDEGGGAGTSFATSVAAVVRRIRSGEFPIASRTCEHCAFGAVCRFEGAAAAGAADEAEAMAP
jgi:ATP-dependent helicase/DNAse subunit B